MGFTAPGDVHDPTTAGLIPTSWGDAVNAAVLWLGSSRPACRVYNSANFTHNSTGNWLAVTFNSERYDTTGLHSVAANTSRITIAETGLYEVGGCVEFAGNSTGRRDVQVWVDGSSANAFLADGNDGLGSGVWRKTINGPFRIAAGSYIELMVFQSSGGNLAVNNNGNYSPEFWCHWIGA